MATRNYISGRVPFVEPLRPNGGRTTLLSMVSSSGAVLAACSCCVFPMALAGMGVSAGLGGALSPLGALRWPMTVFSIVAVAASWFLVLRQRRRAPSCAHADARTWLLSPRMIALIVATNFALLAASWSLFEPTLMRLMA